MYVVKVKNNLNTREFKASFDTIAEAESWIQEMQAKDAWGRDARQAIKGEDEYDLSLVISEFIDTNPDGSTRTIVSLKPEYTITGPTLIDGTGTTQEDKEFRMKDAMKKAAQHKVYRSFGETVELYFASLITTRGFTQTQKDAIQVDPDVIAIMAELRFGRIAKAKALVDAKAADNTLFFAADLTTISQLMADFIADHP